MKELSPSSGLANVLQEHDAVLLVCMLDQAHREEVTTLIQTIENQNETAEQRNNVEVVLWDWKSLSPQQITGTQQQLGLLRGNASLPCALAIQKGKILDKIEGLQDCKSTLPDFFVKFSRYVAQSGVAQVVQPKATQQAESTNQSEGKTLNVNIAKMVMMGNDLMQKGQSLYAEKFFIKALTALKTVVEGEQLQGEEIDGSMVECLSLTIIAQCVQGKVATPECQGYFKDLAQPRYESFCTARTSNGARAKALYAMLHPAPFQYVGADNSVKLLKKVLEAQHKWNEAKRVDDKALEGLSEGEIKLAKEEPWTHLRGRLLTTYFLGGMLDEAFTEGLKLFKFCKIGPEVGDESPTERSERQTAVEGKQMGVRALNAMTTFLGEEDPLVKASLWLEHRPNE